MAQRKQKGDEQRGGAVGWEFGGYYLEVPHPDRGGVYYACRYDAGARAVRRRSLRTADGEEAKQALVVLAAAAPARSASECPGPGQVLTVHVMEAYLNGHATTIRSEGQALRAVDLVVEYLKAVKQVSAPLSFWTPSRQLDFAGWLHRTHQHGAATIERVINVLGAAMNDAAAVKMRLDAIGQPVEGAIVSHVPKIVYPGERIAKELKLPPPKKGGYVPTMVEMATFIDALETPHLRRWVILALNTWARPEAITDFTPAAQYDRRVGAIDLNPPGRVQNDKRRPALPITRGLADWIDHWQAEDLARFEQRYGRRPNEEIPLLVYKLKRVGTVKKAVKRIADKAGVPELTQYSTRRFMATMVRKLCPFVTRERRSMWLGHVVEEGSSTTDHYEGFAVEALEEVAIATDFVIGELQKLTKTKLFAIELRLNAAELRRIGANPKAKSRYRAMG